MGKWWTSWLRSNVSLEWCFDFWRIRKWTHQWKESHLLCEWKSTAKFLAWKRIEGTCLFLWLKLCWMDDVRVFIWNSHAHHCKWNSKLSERSMYSFNGYSPPVFPRVYKKRCHVLWHWRHACTNSSWFTSFLSKERTPLILSHNYVMLLSSKIGREDDFLLEYWRRPIVLGFHEELHPRRARDDFSEWNS